MRSFIVLISLTILVACGEAEEEQTVAPRPVLSMVVADIERFRTDSYPGRAQAVREVNIGFEVPGKLITRPVDVGDRVVEGDILATLEPEPYLAQIRTLQGERAGLEAALSNAETELGRREQLLERDFVSQANVDDQIMIVRAARAQIEAVDGALDAARLNLGYTNLEAPFDGVIAEAFVENFQNVLAKQPVLRLLDTSRIEMEVSVPEDLIGLAPFVREISVTFNSLPDAVLPATISKLGNEASITTRTYPVTVVMDQPSEGPQIQPGMAGRASAVIELPEDWSQNGVLVPAAAVFSPNTAGSDETFVWVVDEGSSTVGSKAVEIVTTENRGLLVRGLDAGERIVIAGANLLTEGQAVRVDG